MRTAPSCRLEKISHSNVENVLYAPTNPIGIRYRHAGVSSTRSPRYSRENPMIRHAVRLITKVPYGKRVPNRLATVPPTQKRATEPSAPPSATSKYFCTLPSLLASARSGACPTHQRPVSISNCHGSSGASDSATEIPVRSHQRSVSEAVQRRIPSPQPADHKMTSNCKQVFTRQLLAREPWNRVEGPQSSPPST